MIYFLYDGCNNSIEIRDFGMVVLAWSFWHLKCLEMTIVKKIFVLYYFKTAKVY